MQRLAVKDFENKSGVGGSLGAQLANYLTTQAKQIIPATGKFTIVHESDPNVEGIFTGEITNINVSDTTAARQMKNSDGTITSYTEYNRKVSVAFSYSVVSSRTKMPVGTVNKSDSRSTSGTQGFSALADPISLAQRIVDSQMRTLEQDIVPTIVSTSRKLMKETSKDKAVKQLMKIAQTLVKNGNYEEAIEQYDLIGSEYDSVAAKINAKIIREAIASDIAARAELAELFNDKDGLAEKAAKGATDELHSKVPSGANIMIMKTSSTERNMLEYIVDQMDKTVVQEGKLKLVERTNLDLINAEQQYQATGNVSDDSFVSIGKQLGAKYIVLCWISGQMSTRRLNLRVLNVETAQVIDQKDFEI